MSNYSKFPENANSAPEAAGRASDAVESELTEPLRDAFEDAVKRGEEYARYQGEQLEAFVKRKPIVAVGAAFGLGVLITIIVRLKAN